MSDSHLSFQVPAAETKKIYILLENSSKINFEEFHFTNKLKSKLKISQVIKYFKNISC